LSRSHALPILPGIAFAADPDLVRAETLVREGRYPEAYDLLAPFRDARKDDAQFNYLLGRAALGTKRAEDALALLERSLAQRPNDVAARLVLGRAYFALGRHAEAKIEFETVLRFDNLPPDLESQAEIYDRTPTASTIIPTPTTARSCGAGTTNTSLAPASSGSSRGPGRCGRRSSTSATRATRWAGTTARPSTGSTSATRFSAGAPGGSLGRLRLLARAYAPGEFVESFLVPLFKALVLVPVTLLPIINPLSTAPVFVATVGGDPSLAARVARQVAINNWFVVLASRPGSWPGWARSACS
jgi:hypothetical protein